MSINLLKNIISCCIEKGCSFVEIMSTRLLCTKLGFYDKTIANQKIEFTYLVISTIYKGNMNKIFLPVNYDTPIDFLVSIISNNLLSSKNLLSSNIITQYAKYKKQLSHSTLFFDKSDLYNEYKRKMNNEFLNSMYKWILLQSNNIENNFNVVLRNIMYCREFTEVTLINSVNQIGRYYLDNSQINGEIQIISNNNQNTNIAYFCLYDINESQDITKELNENNNQNNVTNKIHYLKNFRSAISQARGVIKLSYSACAQLILSLMYIFDSNIIYTNRAIIKTQDIGEKFCCNYINLIDDPINNNCKNKYYFDMEGSITSKKYLIKNGIINDTFGSIENKYKTGICTPGNLFYKFPLYTKPTLCYSNIIFEIDRQISQQKYDIYIDEFSIDTRVDIQSGLVLGNAYGFFANEQQKSPHTFLFKVNIKDILKEPERVSESRWINSINIPEIVFYAE